VSEVRECDPFVLFLGIFFGVILAPYDIVFVLQTCLVAVLLQYVLYCILFCILGGVFYGICVGSVNRIING
jgi:hypothetical protein